MKEFDLAFHGPGGKLVLSWRMQSRLEHLGRSLDLENTSYEIGNGSELVLQVEHNMEPSHDTTCHPLRNSLLFQDGVVTLAFLLSLNAIETAPLAPSVNVD